MLPRPQEMSALINRAAREAALFDHMILNFTPKGFPKMENRQVLLRVGTAELKMQFDFRGLSDAGKAVEGRHVGLAIMEAAEKSDMELLAKLGAIALRRHHADLTAEWLMDQSPLIDELVAALLDCFSLAYRGKTVAQHIAEEQAKRVAAQPAAA